MAKPNPRFTELARQFSSLEKLFAIVREYPTLVTGEQYAELCRILGDLCILLSEK